MEPLSRIELLTPSLPRKCSTPELQRRRLFIWAEDGARTRHLKLGRLPLYQMSYFREISLSPPFCGGRRIRTSEGCANRFTVCPIWPLWYPPGVIQGGEPCLTPGRLWSSDWSSIIQRTSSTWSALRLIRSSEPMDGFEPPTSWLQISCSTSWATSACFPFSKRTAKLETIWIQNKGFIKLKQGNVIFFKQILYRTLKSTPVKAFRKWSRQPKKGCLLHLFLNPP